MFKTGDLVITNNFTLKNDVNIVDTNGKLKVVKRGTAEEIFSWIENYVDSEFKKGNRKEYNTFTVYSKSNLTIPKSFKYKSKVRGY